MSALQTIAARAAMKAGGYLLQSLEKLDQVRPQQKGDNDYVSKVDETAERIIIDTIKKSYPDHGFLAEEGGAQAAAGDSAVTWIIDPLDGTTNYLHGFPHYAISIAASIDGKVDAGVVYDPIRDEMFAAAKGAGAKVNNRRMRISAAKSLEHTIIATGFPFKNKDKTEQYLKEFGKVFAQCGDIRRAGSAALDLAYVAAGRVDGFWEHGLDVWDYAAGTLLIKEAGGLVGDIKGNPDFESADSLLAGNPKVFKAMLQALR